MSWRTQGCYRGLGEKEKEWVREFDRKWETRAEGRSQQDAFDFLRQADQELRFAPTQIVMPDVSEGVISGGNTPLEIALDLRLEELRDRVARYTVPRPTRTGWSIHLILTCGKRIRAKFADKASAYQSYSAIQDILSMIIES